jgi:hypothetical protein
MNYLARGLSSVVLLVSTFMASAQQHKMRPLLFDRYRDSLSCSSYEIEKIFKLAAGSPVEAKLSPEFTIRGHVRASIVKYANLKTVIIDCADMGGAIFSISARNEGGSLTYVGRILTNNYADGFELQQDNRGNYQLKKFKVEDVIMD